MPVFYGFNRFTGEVFVPMTENERKNCVKGFICELRNGYRVDHKIPLAWRLFRTEKSMLSYANSYCASL